MKTHPSVTVYVVDGETEKDHGTWLIDVSTPERTPRMPRKSELWED